MSATMDNVGFLLAPVSSLEEYRAAGGLTGLQRAVDLGPQATIAEVAASGLRGRGGGGFPTGRKWSGVASQPGTHRYVVANGAEGEPATFKDRALMRANPFQLVEGLIIAAFALDAREAFICLKASFSREIEAVERAIASMQAAGVCQDCAVTVVQGPEEYLYGEEKALLEVIEGNPPLPRILPPYQHGLFATAPQLGWQATTPDEHHAHADESNPTLVNNVETLSNVAHILARGSEWFRTFGTPDSPGTLLTTVVGDASRPCVREVEMGTPLAEILAAAGVPLPDRQVKAVFSGVSNPVIGAEHLEVPLTYEDFQLIGSGLGAAGFSVWDDTACMVEVARQFSRFLHVESCGQCPACKLGSGEITAHLEDIEAGVATDHDLEDIHGWLLQVTDGNRCYLAVEEQALISSILRGFPDEFAQHLEQGRCPRPREIPLPKIVDLVDGSVTYDQRQYYKRPDWTYAPTPNRDVMRAV